MLAAERGAAANTLSAYARDLNGAALLVGDLVMADRAALAGLGEAWSALAPASLARVFILFPDPWPKTRHHKRRLIQLEVIAALARALRPGGRLRFATDWRAYAAWTLERMLRSPDFRWTAQTAADWRTPPADHLTTRYETKALGDCAPIFLDFERL